MNPVKKKTVKQIVKVFGIHERIAERLYVLVDWIYGTSWDRTRIRIKEPIKDKPSTLIISNQFTSPSQELSYLMKKYRIKFNRLSRIV